MIKPNREKLRVLILNYFSANKLPFAQHICLNYLIYCFDAKKKKNESKKYATKFKNIVNIRHRLDLKQRLRNEFVEKRPWI